MKNNILFLLIVLMMSGISDKMNAREVTSFNDGWEFKKGPFSKETMQAVQKWNTDWQEVTIPHTWNADDMQKRCLLSMKVQPITGKVHFPRKSGR